MKLSSGFTVSVKPLPPYYKDIVDDAIPLPVFPKRKVHLVAGDVDHWLYEPPDDPPDPSDKYEYELYMQWKTAGKEIAAVNDRRNKVRRDFLLSNCVIIIDGPYSVDDDGWVHRVEGAFDDYTISKHSGRRMLVFIKTQVITTIEEHDEIIRLCTCSEVTMAGVVSALQGYDIKWEGDDIADAIMELPSGKLSHNMRLWEAKASQLHSISFNTDWYKLPVVEREQMVAAIIADVWGAALVGNDVVKRL